MINFALFRKECKASWKILIVFILILTLYMGMIIYMYNPDLSAMMNSMMEAMPEVFNAVGMGAGGSGLIGFMVQYLYGFILILFPSIFMLMIANKVVCKYVDSGSMAYLLATPNTRKKIILTQWVVLMFLVFVIMLFVTSFGLIVSAILFPNELDMTLFLQLNCALFILYFFIGSLFFCLSCAMNESDKVFGLGGAVLFLFYVFQAIANMGDKLEVFKYFTFFTLFNPSMIVADISSQYGPLGILFIAGVFLSVVGIAHFSNRDLSL